MSVKPAELDATLKEIPSKPEPQVDWSKAPEGATHYSKRFGDYYKAQDGFLLIYLADEGRWLVVIDFSITALRRPHLEMI